MAGVRIKPGETAFWGERIPGIEVLQVVLTLLLTSYVIWSLSLAGSVSLTMAQEVELGKGSMEWCKDWVLWPGFITNLLCDFEQVSEPLHISLLNHKMSLTVFPS